MGLFESLFTMGSGLAGGWALSFLGPVGWAIGFTAGSFLGNLLFTETPKSEKLALQKYPWNSAQKNVILSKI